MKHADLNSGQISRRKALGYMAAGVAAAATTNRARAQASKAPIKIGVVLPLSGAYAAQGLAGAQGIKLAADLANQQGGLLGRRVEVIVEDTQLKPQNAVVKGTKLIKQDGVSVLMGALSGASTLALNGLVNREKVVLVTPYSSPEAVTGTRGTRYEFRTYSNAYIQAACAAKYITENVGKRWGVMAANYAYGQDYVAHLKKLIPMHGGKLVNLAMPALGSPDFSSYLEQATAGSIDVLWMVEYGRDATVAMDQAVAMGLKKKMALGLAVANTEQVAGMQPGTFEGTYSFLDWYPNWKGNGSETFVKAYYNRYKAYSEAAGVHYIGAQVLMAAIQRAKSLDAQNLIKVMEGGEFDTIKGKLKLRAYDHQAIQRYCIGKGKVTAEYPYPIYDPVKWYEPEEVEKSFMLPPDPKVHPVAWRK